MHPNRKGAGVATGGLNFDATVRRKSTDPEDSVHGHTGGMDAVAQPVLDQNVDV